MRKCYVCGTEFEGHGGRCPVHVAALIREQAAERARSERVTAEREARAKAERRARGHLEWMGLMESDDFLSKPRRERTQ